MTQTRRMCAIDFFKGKNYEKTVKKTVKNASKTAKKAHKNAAEIFEKIFCKKTCFENGKGRPAAALPIGGILVGGLYKRGCDACSSSPPHSLRLYYNRLREKYNRQTVNKV